MNVATRLPRPRSAGRAAGGVAAVGVLAAAYAAGALLHWGALPGAADDGDSLGELMGDLGLSAVAVAAGISCVLRAWTVRGGRRASWLLFAASATTAGLGNGIWGWYELVLRRSPPSPSVADWVFLFFAPFAMAGVLVHHRGLGSVGAWAKLGLDGTMIAGALFSAGWSVALARDSLAGGGSAYTLVLGLAYPIFDILLVSLVGAVRFRGGQADGPSMATLVLGYSVVVVCDAIWTLPSVRAGYSSGGLLDAGWFFGYLLLVIAPWMSGWVAEAPARPAHPALPHLVAWSRRTLGALGLLFPYLAGVLCLGGIMVDGLSGDHEVHPVLLSTGGVVLVALVARQAVTLLENASLTRQLAVREEHFRSLVQGSSDVILTVDTGGRIGYISPAVTHVFGYGHDQLVGTELRRLVHPEDWSLLAAATGRFLNSADLSLVVECRIQARRPIPLDDGHTSLWRHTESTLTRHRGGLVFTCRDVSDRVALQQQLAYNAYHDSLTALPNRALFAERLERAVAQRFAGAQPVAVLFLDLDWFKAVNDTAGHAAGDALLVEAAARLRGSVRAGDTVARFGGDEFAALVHTGPHERPAREVAERLHAELTRPYLIGGRQFTVGASIGVAHWRGSGTAAELMREADLAMYEAKAAGKGRVVSREPSIR